MRQRSWLLAVVVSLAAGSAGADKVPTCPPGQRLVRDEPTEPSRPGDPSGAPGYKMSNARCVPLDKKPAPRPTAERPPEETPTSVVPASHPISAAPESKPAPPNRPGALASAPVAARQPTEAAQTSACAVQADGAPALAPLVLLAGLLCWRRRAKNR